MPLISRVPLENVRREAGPRASGGARSFVAFEGESQALPGPIGWVDDGAWLDDNLLVLHGNSTVAVTTFAAVSR